MTVHILGEVIIPVARVKSEAELELPKALRNIEIFSRSLQLGDGALQCIALRRLRVLNLLSFAHRGTFLRATATSDIQSKRWKCSNAGFEELLKSRNSRKELRMHSLTKHPVIGHLELLMIMVKFPRHEQSSKYCYCASTKHRSRVRVRVNQNLISCSRESVKQRKLSHVRKDQKRRCFSRWKS